MRGLLVVGDSLRVPSGQASTGLGRTDLGSACAVGSGGAMGWETPRTAHLWIPAFAGMTRAGEGDAGVGGGGPLRVPFDRLRANGFGEARVRWGVGNAMGDGDAPRGAPLDSCLRRNDARGGVREGRGGAPVRRRTETAPHRAPCPGFPLSRERRWGSAGRRGLLVAEGPSTGSGRTDLGGAPSVGSGGCDGGRSRPAPRPSGFLPSQE